MKKLRLFFLIICLHHFAIAQQSAKKVAEDNFDKISEFFKTDLDSMEVYLDENDQLIKSNPDFPSSYKGRQKFLKGCFQYKKGHYLRSMHLMQEGIDMLPQDSVKANFYFYLALAHKNLGNYSQSSEAFLKAARKYKEDEDYRGLIAVYTNLGNVLRQINRYPEALKYLNQALHLSEEKQFETIQRNIYSSLGNVFLDLEDYTVALANFQESYKLAQNTGSKKGVFFSLINMAGAKRKMGSNEDALEFYRKAILYADTLENVSYKSKILWEIGDFMIDIKNFSNAKYYLAASHEIADTLNNYPDLRNIYKSYQKLYKEQGNYKKSLEYYVLYEAMKDSVISRENALKVTELYSQFELEKKEQELILLENERELARQKSEIVEAENLVLEAEKQKDEILIYLLAGMGVLLLTLAGTGFFMYTNKQKKNSELEAINRELEDTKLEITLQRDSLDQANQDLAKFNQELTSKNEEVAMQKAELEAQRDLLNQTNVKLAARNKDVTDSIHYAQKIQQAMLNSSFELDKTLFDHFVFYKPRDIVSGDFYWSAVIAQQLILAVGDCTGHGVPGAFMSCLGISLLNEIVYERKITNTQQILEELRSSVIKLISQDRNAELQIGDGMDIAIISIDINSKKMAFSGAMNPVRVVRNGIIEEIKGDKSPIGVSIIPDHQFSTQHYQLQKGDCVYLTSDGYQDQFGGPKGKKMGKRNLHQLLTDISFETMPKQYNSVISYYKNWKGFEGQVDDICLLGIKI